MLSGICYMVYKYVCYMTYGVWHVVYGICYLVYAYMFMYMSIGESVNVCVYMY